MKLTQKKVNKLFLKAIENGDLNSVKYLLNDSIIKADLYVKNEVEDPLYALLVCSMYNQLEILQYLLENTELKQYTIKKGSKEFYKEEIGDTIFMMYEYAGQTGNLQLIQYLNQKLHWENKFDVFSHAALNNHTHALSYLLDNNYLTEVDKIRLCEPKNNAIDFAITNNAKDSVKFLLDYYKKNQPDLLKNEVFLNHCLIKSIEAIKDDTEDFEIFNIFYNNPKIQSNQEKFLKNKIFQKIANRKNVELFKTSVEKIKSKDLEKKLIVDSYYYAVEDHGRLSDYPLYQHIIENYSSYFSKQEKENIFINLIYAKDRSRFHDLIQYDFLTKNIDYSYILRETVYHVQVEDTFEYTKDILKSDFSKKIKIHEDNNYFFNMIKKELEEEKILELLKLVLSQCNNVNVKKIKSIFTDNKNIENFLDKCVLNDKLKVNLPEKNIKTKTYKI